jgi:hypothetical protein
LHFLRFTDQQEALAIVHPVNTNLFLGCGKTVSTVLPANAGITYFKVTNDGQQLFYRKLKMEAESECRGFTYDYEKAQGTLLVSSRDDTIRVLNRYANNADDKKS